MMLRFAPWLTDAGVSKRQTVIYALAWVAIFVAVTSARAYTPPLRDWFKPARQVTALRGGGGTSFRNCA